MVNTSWTSWYNISSCYANNTIDQARNRTQYDSNSCGEVSNSTFFEYQAGSCNYTDPTPPSVVDVSASPGAIDQGQSTNITANVTDLNGLAEVWARVTNPLGSVSDYSMNQNGDIWYYLLTSTSSNPAGVYNTTIRAKDNYNNWNDSEKTTFTVNDVTKPQVTSVFIANSIYDLGSKVEIYANVTDETQVSKVIANVSWDSVYVLINMVLQSNNITYQGNFTNTNYVDSYTIQIVANDTTNNLNNSEKVYFSVTDIGAPVYSGITANPASPATYSPGQSYQFNVTWTDNYLTDTVIIEHDFNGAFANYSVDNVSTEYYYGYSDLSAGTYYWRMYANDSSGNKNQTTQQTYVVDKASVSCSLTFSPSSPQNYETSINASCSCNSPEASEVLYRDGTDVTSENNELVVLGAGNYSYNCTVSATQNYTSADDSSIYIINKKASSINLTLNGESNDKTINQTQSIIINASLIVPSSGSLRIYENGTLLNIGTSPLSSTKSYDNYSTYNITAVYLGSDNYTSSEETLYIIVQNSIPPATITGLSKSSSGYSWIYWTWNNPSDSDFDHTEIYVDGAFVGNSSSEYYNATGFTPATNHTISTITVDVAGNRNTTWVNYTSFTPADVTNPQITGYSVSPKSVINGRGELISANVTDDFAVDDLYVNITLPNSTVVSYSLPVNYTTKITGRHNVTIIANDTSGNEVTQEDYFVVGDAINFTLNVVDKEFGSLSVLFKIFFPGTNEKIDEQSINGNFNEQEPNYIYDLEFESSSTNLTVRLNRVNISLNANKTIGFDKLPSPVEGYIVSYGIYSTFTFNYAGVTLSYAGANYSDESMLRVYKCDNWDFTNRVCLGSFAEVSASQDTGSDLFTVSVNSFSGFSIAEIAPAQAAAQEADEDNIVVRPSRGCIVDWQCEIWGDCSAEGIQKRVCRNTGTCPDSFGVAPITERDCSYTSSCEDGIQNQDEEGVDCGGQCPPCLECFDDYDCGPGYECITNECSELAAPLLAPSGTINICRAPYMSLIGASIILLFLYSILFGSVRRKLKEEHTQIMAWVIVLLPIVSRLLLGCTVAITVLGLEFIFLLAYSFKPMKEHKVTHSDVKKLREHGFIVKSEVKEAKDELEEEPEEKPEPKKRRLFKRRKSEHKPEHHHKETPHADKPKEEAVHPKAKPEVPHYKPKVEHKPEPKRRKTAKEYLFQVVPKQIWSMPKPIKKEEPNQDAPKKDLKLDKENEKKQEPVKEGSNEEVPKKETEHKEEPKNEKSQAKEEPKKEERREERALDDYQEAEEKPKNEKQIITGLKEAYKMDKLKNIKPIIRDYKREEDTNKSSNTEPETPKVKKEAKKDKKPLVMFYMKGDYDKKEEEDEPQDNIEPEPVEEKENPKIEPEPIKIKTKDDVLNGLKKAYAPKEKKKDNALEHIVVSKQEQFKNRIHANKDHIEVEEVLR